MGLDVEIDAPSRLHVGAEHVEELLPFVFVVGLVGSGFKLADSLCDEFPCENRQVALQIVGAMDFGMNARRNREGDAFVQISQGGGEGPLAQP